MNRTLHLPIAATSLAHYMSHAAIKPAAFIANKPKDLQDINPSYILLTESTGCSAAECSIEVELIDEENRNLTRLENGWFLYRGIIPATRIRGIYFTDKEKCDNTVTNIEMSTAFIPGRLLKIIQRFDANPIPRDAAAMMAAPADNCREQADMYNRLLGAFMLMRTASFRQTYIPPAYFGLLGQICPKVETESKTALGTEYVQHYGSLFTRDIHNSKVRWLSTNIDRHILEEIASREGIRLEYDPLTRIVRFDNLPDELYVYAILATYGVGQEARPRKIDELILSDFTKGIKPSKGQVVATYYGFNRGYAVFPKQYRSQSGARIRYTKFAFDNLVDCYTVESVYRYVFLNNTKVDCSDMESRWPQKATVTGGLPKILDYTVRPRQKVVHTAYGIQRLPEGDDWLRAAVDASMSAFDPRTTTIYTYALTLAHTIYQETVRRQQTAVPRQVDTTMLKRQIVAQLDNLNAMSVPELRQLARRMDIHLPPKATRQQIVNTILLTDN